MARIKDIVTAVGTLACALGIGFVMQSTETATHAAIPVDFGQEQSAVIDVQEVTLTYALPRIPQIASKVISAAPGLEGTANAVNPEGVCELSATATATRAATAALELTAPCHADERVTVHHNGMNFAARTDTNGHLRLTVPGLDEQAVFIFVFSDGDGVVAQTRLPDMLSFNRVVLQWTGRTGFELHAREFGAEYGSDGHVWHGSETASLDNLTNGTGGHMTSLGRTDMHVPHFAQVYTFPANMSGRNGQIDLSVEAEITAANCGLEIEAQLHEHVQGGQVRTRTLTLAIPGCDAIGDYLVLNNVLDDMKVAAR